MIREGLWCMNEFEECYAYVLLNKGDVLQPATFVAYYTIVMKETG